MGSISGQAPHECSEQAKKIESVFRTNAWIEAWLDTYGKQPGVDLIDLTGCRNPAHILYRYKPRSAIFSQGVVGLAGCPVPGFSSPRSEYNDLDELHQQFHSDKSLCQALSNVQCSRIYLPDFIKDPAFTISKFGQITKESGTAYRVCSEEFDAYLSNLGKNTRSRYFNKYSRLESDHTLSFDRLAPKEFLVFTMYLNQFHLARWGRNCYSDLSVAMLSAFTKSLEMIGGESILELMIVNGKVESAIFDVVWKGVRYNLQAGYNESFNNQLKLGSLHIGRSIKQSIESRLVFDMLAGTGRAADYKSSLATESFGLRNVEIYKGMARLKFLIKSALKTLKSSGGSCE